MEQTTQIDLSIEGAHACIRAVAPPKFDIGGVGLQCLKSSEMGLSNVGRYVEEDRHPKGVGNEKEKERGGEK